MTPTEDPHIASAQLRDLLGKIKNAAGQLSSPGEIGKDAQDALTLLDQIEPYIGEP